MGKSHHEVTFNLSSLHGDQYFGMCLPVVKYELSHSLEKMFNGMHSKDILNMKYSLLMCFLKKIFKKHTYKPSPGIQS